MSAVPTARVTLVRRFRDTALPTVSVPTTRNAPATSVSPCRAVHARRPATTLALRCRDAVLPTVSAQATKPASTTSVKSNAAVKATNTAKAANATCRRASAIQGKIVNQTQTVASVTHVFLCVHQRHVVEKLQIVVLTVINL